MFPPGTTERLMERFCSYATLEVVPELETPVFGSFGYYFVLKGSVRTMSKPYLKTHNTTIPNKPHVFDLSTSSMKSLRSETPEPKYPHIVC